MTGYLALTPRDPVIIRDGRPFGAASGRRMVSLPWPTPSLLAGTVRTALGKRLGGGFDAAMVGRLKSVEVAGPFPVADGRLYLPAPADAHRRGGGLWAARPVADGGTDLPDGLRPVCLPADRADGKYEPVPAWWAADVLAEWLATPAHHLTQLDDTARFLDAPAPDERTHLEIDPATFAAKDGLLFSTAGLPLDPMRAGVGDTRLTARVRAAEAVTLSALHPFGGERRLIDIRPDDTAPSWECPPAVRAALTQVEPGGGVRMVLATPAMFAPGWRPGWLNAENGRVGVVPGTTVRVRLVGVANERPQHVSGWSYEIHGPKPVRRLVPAGGVYFFELVSGDPAELSGRWLEPVSDAPADRTDGFGLAVWGVWAAGGGG